MRRDDPHPLDRELLLSLDRELPAQEQRRVARHLTSCSTCRDRRSRLLRLSALVAERQHRDVSAEADADLTRRSRARLTARLDEAAHQAPSTPRLFRRLQRLGVPAAAAVAVAALLVVGPGRSDDSSPEVSPRAGIHDAALPIPALTPGATWTVAAADLCAATARDRQEIPGPVRDAVLRSYGMTSVPAEHYELDYLITPELGGSPDARNLWPQRYASGIWNAYVKDQLEDLLPRMVCDGQVPLQRAQQDIAVNWIAAYKRYFHTDVPLPNRRASTTSPDWTGGDDDRVRSPLWRASSRPGPRLVAVSGGSR
jgi:hypothetical protein